MYANEKWSMGAETVLRTGSTVLGGCTKMPLMTKILRSASSTPSGIQASS